MFFSATLFFSEFALTQNLPVKKTQPKPLIAASISPIYQIALAITQDQKNTLLIMNPKFSEHDYQLKKEDLLVLKKASLVFYLDKDLEHIFAKMAKNTNFYALSKVAGMKILPQKQNQKRQDLHLWLNPQNGLKIAEFITQKLCELDDGNCQFYQKNLNNFKSELEKAITVSRQNLAKIEPESYSFYHESFRYFEDFFALKALEIVSKDHESDLTIKDARRFFEVSKTKKIKCLFAEAQSENSAAKKIAEKYQIYFAALDFIGNKKSYPNLILNISNDISACLAR